ncbi:MAG TPA: 2-oxoglutarate dehydrogenase E1 component [Thermoanaerobaculia bacterium]
MTTDVATAAEPRTREQVLEAYRRWGYLQADLDPLGRLRPESHPELPGEGDGVEEARRAYCGTLAVETAHMPDPERRRWIYERMESGEPRDGGGPDKERILRGLVRAETFEQVLQSRYLGTKRFSIEGVTALVPMLWELLDAAGDHEAEQAVLAMSHRGRLSVMLNVVGRPAEDLFAGFEDVDPRSVLGGGDVKYHLGATGRWQTRGGRTLRLHLASNPSHLEAVDPVVNGRVWAKQQRHRVAGAGGVEACRKVAAILMHGDAAFAGQGVLAETLNFHDLDGFSVGGLVHVIVNNWIGFTTEPHALWSWRFTTDVAKRLPVPIFHVNGEDPEAVVRVARIAMDYRYRFGSDVVVDLIGYRRHGHSEVDDPSITQPLLYKKIEEHPRLWRLYAEDEGLEERAKELDHEFREELDRAQEKAKGLEQRPRLAEFPEYWKEFRGGRYEPGYEVETGLSEEKVRELADRLTTAPDGFHVHDKVERLLDERRKMGYGERPVDYGMAEALAFASLVDEGVPVRLSGQDSRRATFNQRHAVLIDVETDEEYFPLQNVRGGQAFFEIYDSMLSEAAVLGFEYGVSRDYPEALVLWEAQFGDFVNGAQILIDQFLTAGEDKWGLLSGLVLLLPHGYEGQGPEHSSARIERFLQAAAEDNIQVAQPSTAAQYFHLLRRQALRKWRKPLVVFTPKSMLRAKPATSPVESFTRERFLTVMPERKLEKAERALVATGKVLHELRHERDRREDDSTAILGLEQMYPFPADDLLAELDRLGPLREIVWIQEEPANMGALSFVVPRLERISRGRPVRTIKRAESASPATGSPEAHKLEQKTLLTLAFTAKGAN